MRLVFSGGGVSDYYDKKEVLQSRFNELSRIENENQDLLKEIASETEGKYFRATNNASLKEIYAEIDTLEKTKIEEFKYYNYQEKYRFFVFLGIGFLLLEFILKNTLFKSFI
mgnify:CR=1 FL=1